MKKFYSIGLLALAALFSTNTNAQCPASTVAVNYGLTSGCSVFVQTDSSFIGARIRIYTETAEVTTAPAFIVADSRNSSRGGGAAAYPCEHYDDITRVTIEKNGDICFANISSNINLPIKLSSFTASLKGSASVQLNWTTSFEANSSIIGVEKSTDGKNFTTIGTIAAAGNSNAAINYAYEDKSFSGTAFYRLRLVDLDGKTEYSAVRYANGGPNAATSFSVFPNPFRSDVQLKGINAYDVNKSNIRVFGATGKEVSYKITGANSIAIDASLPKGVYILRVKDQTYKLVKE